MRMRNCAGVVLVGCWLALSALGQSNSATLAYQFGTLAGATPGYADGTGSAARFDYPNDVAVDGAGNVYVVDSDNYTIRKITPAGVTTTLAGQPGYTGNVDGPGSSARFGSSYRIAVDGGGNIYVSDSANNSVRKVSPDGTVSTLATRIFGPDGIAADPAGNVYVVAQDASSILKITPQGAVSTLATLPTLGRVLAIDPAGNCYVGELTAIRKVAPDGTSAVFAGNETVSGSTNGTGTDARFQELDGISYDSTQHRLVVVDAGYVRQISAAGVVSALAGTPGAVGSQDGAGSAAQFFNPEGVTVDGSGNIYVPDTFNSTIRKVSSGGVVTTFAGVTSRGNNVGTGPLARFFEVQGAACDANGNVYVTDPFSAAIRKVTPSGQVTALAANVFWGMPWGIASDGAGNLYVTDEIAASVLKIRPDGTVVTIAGGNGTGFQDGSGTAAKFSYPEAIAVDAAGNLFVGDTGNSSLRKITPTGLVSTVPGVTGQIAGLAFDASGVLYTADLTTVHKLNADGSYTLFAGQTSQGSNDGQGSLASFTFPSGLAFEASGALLVVDSLNHTLRRITPDGTVSTVAGAAKVPSWRDGRGADARFNWPTAIAIGPTGAIYVTDSYNHAVRVAAGSPATLVTGPVSQSVKYGQSVTFSASINASLSASAYQWTYNGQPIAGATSSGYTFNTTLASAGAYAVTVTSAGGTATSAAAALTVIPVPPTIDYQPISLTAALGQSATLFVSVSGTPTTGYQWNYGGVPIFGATSSSYTIPSVSATSVGKYSVTVTGPGGSVVSNAATLVAVSGTGAPITAVQPVSETVAAGAAAVLTFSAQLGNSGPTGAIYQWWFNGRPIGGASGSQLLLPAVTAANVGSYLATATYGGITTVSVAANLTVSTTPDLGRLINCSVLMPLGRASQMLTLGITTQGSSGSEPVLIRGIGPSLAAFGVLNPLPDPRLTVYTGTTIFTANQGWGTPFTNANAVTAADTVVFAFPLTSPTSLDAAVVASLATNQTYTVQIASAGGNVGTVLGEIYDATPGSYTAGTPCLTNLSCLGTLASGSTLTAGFTIGGSTACTVLIRASGPALASFGVGADLADPQLTLHTVVSGQDTVLRTNAAWSGTSALVEADTATGAFQIANPGSNDAAILTTLNPGTYTAQVTSASGSSGNVLIELFAVP